MVRTLRTLLLIYAACCSTQAPAQSYVALQSVSPGSSNVGHYNVSGKGISQVQDSGGQVFNVKNAYTFPRQDPCFNQAGAKGDGIADDTAAINCAVKAAGAGATYLPPGRYIVTAPIALPTSGARLVGAGVQATQIHYKYTNKATDDIIELGVSTSFVIPGSSVAHLSIDADLGHTGGAAIRLFNGEQFSIDDVRIGPMKGIGISTTSNNPSDPAHQDENIIFISRVDIEMQAGTGVVVNNAGEVHLDHAWIRGPISNGGTVPGSVGIDASQGQITASDVEVVQFEQGVLVFPGAGQVASDSIFRNVLADNNSLYGWHIGGSGTAQRMLLSDCWAGTNGTLYKGYSTLAGAGIQIEGGNGIVITNVRAINNYGNGIHVVSNPTNLEVGGGIVSGNGTGNPGVYQGIVVETNTQGFRIHDVRIGPVTSSNTQAWGIFVVGGSDRFVISGNDTTGNLVGGINNVPGVASTRIVANNLQ